VRNEVLHARRSDATEPYCRASNRRRMSSSFGAGRKIPKTMPRVTYGAESPAHDRTVRANSGIVVSRLAGAIGLRTDGGVSLAARRKDPMAHPVGGEATNRACQGGAVGADLGIVGHGQTAARSGRATGGLCVDLTGPAVGGVGTRRKIPAASTGRPYRADASSEGRAVRANLGIELARQIPADFGRAGARFAVRANRNVATPRATIVVGSGHERKRKKDGDQVTEATCQRVRSFHAWFSDQRLTPYMAGRAAIRGDIINGRCLRDRRSCIHAPRCEGARSWEMNGGIVRWRCGPPPIGRYGKER
jgi:hypothetical protein